MAFLGWISLWFLSPSLPSLRRTGCLPFFATPNWHFFFLVAYFTDLVTAVMHGGRGKGPTTEGGRERGRDPPTHALFTDIWSCCCCCCNRRSADLLPPPLKSRIRKRRKSDAPPESLLGPPSPPSGRIELLLSWMHCRACQVVMDDAGSPKDKRFLQVRRRRRSRRIAAAIKLLLGETRRSSSRRGR